MNRLQTAGEVRKEFGDKMGPDLGTIYYELWNECGVVHIEWDEFKELYGSGQRRVDLLNTAAGPFFRLVQSALMDSILLRLCRMTDPPKTTGKQNLTLEQLADKISETDQPFGQEVSRLAIHARSRCEFARDSRNRRIAHRDLYLALKKGKARPLTSIRVEDIDGALQEVVNVIQTVNMYYFNSGVIFKGIPPTAGYATSLLCVLRDGVKAEEARRQRIASGRYTKEDLRPDEKL
jgi:hypothetical protein